VDRGAELAEDQAPEADDVGAEQVARGLPLGALLEAGLERRRCQRVLPDGWGHEGAWGWLEDPLEDLAQDQGRCLRGCAVTPHQAAAYQKV
jgi:hypothetical protein